MASPPPPVIKESYAELDGATKQYEQQPEEMILEEELDLLPEMEEQVPSDLIDRMETYTNEKEPEPTTTETPEMVCSTMYRLSTSV